MPDNWKGEPRDPATGKWIGSHVTFKKPQVGGLPGHEYDSGEGVVLGEDGEELRIGVVHKGGLSRGESWSRVTGIQPEHVQQVLRRPPSHLSSDAKRLHGEESGSFKFRDAAHVSYVTGWSKDRSQRALDELRAANRNEGKAIEFDLKFLDSIGEEDKERLLKKVQDPQPEVEIKSTQPPKLELTSISEYDKLRLMRRKTSG